MVKKKKPGRKLGVKVGPYKKTFVDSDEIKIATNNLKVLIRKRINHLNKMLKELK